MTRGGQSGFSLIEALFALAILGIALAGILPSFLGYLDNNTASEERSDAVAAAQRAMEDLRRQDPAGMPTSGTSAAQIVPVGSREYEVFVHYCLETSWCSTNTRHVTVEVNFGGSTLFTVSTVYTRLR